MDSVRHILHLDDNPADLELVRLAIAEAGHRDIVVDGVASPQAALDRLAAGPVPELIICDLRLPDGDGMQFIQRLRRLPALARVSVILLTGVQASDEPREQPFVAGIYHKPPVWTELVELMSGLVRRFLPPRDVVVVPSRPRTDH
jgi:CheY-like chemotaxis protein